MANTNEQWRRTFRRGERRFRNERSVAFFNGWLFIVSSPLLMLGGTVVVVEEYGLLGLRTCGSGRMSAPISRRVRPPRISLAADGLVLLFAGRNSHTDFSTRRRNR